MIKSKYPIFGLFCLVQMYGSSIARAENMVFIPRATVGYMDYRLSTPGIPFPEFPGSPLPERTTPNHYKTTMRSYGIGLTLFKNGFYMDNVAQTTTKGRDSLTAPPPLNYSEDFTGIRNDISSSIGYMITDTSSAYFGYKYGKTAVKGNRDSRPVFKAAGSFIGGTYGFRIGSKSILSLNLALAQLQGEIDYTINLLSPPFPQLPSRLNAVTETTGFSYGLMWRSNITGNLMYSISYDIYEYTFKDIIDRKIAAYSGEFVEKMRSAKLAISYNFAL